ncbi:MAG: hypothetical protein Q7U28_19690 [Aquabacterium sp.]|nr:hypothetical protein [Aquabacterium sp.]
MNPLQLVNLSRLALIAGLVAASVSAQAGGVYWAVNVDAPMQGVGRVATAVSNVPHGVYRQAPPVVYVNAPVVTYRQPVYTQRPVFYEPVVYQPVVERRCEPRRMWGWGDGRRDGGERHFHRSHHEREEGRDWHHGH